MNMMRRLGYPLFALLFLAPSPAGAQANPFSDDFEGGNLNSYTKTGSLVLTTANPIAGRNSVTGTGSAYVTATALGPNWKTAHHGEVSADFRLSSENDRIGIGFASASGVWIFAEAATTEIVVKTRAANGTITTVESKPFAVSENIKYNLVLRWSKKSRSILAILHYTNGDFQASVTTICATHDPGNPLFTVTGTAFLPRSTPWTRHGPKSGRTST
jgi:hypothetical protein